MRPLAASPRRRYNRAPFSGNPWSRHVTVSLWTSLASIIGVWLITVISPGPNFFATAHAAATQSRRHGLALSLGIAVGTTIWASASLLGLGLLFQAAAWLYQGVKLVGGAYLVYLGIRMMLASARAPDAPAAGRGPVTAAGAFRRGMIIDLSNPKAAVFFTSLFAVAVPVHAPLWFQALVVLSVVTIAGGWYALIACLVNVPVVGRARRAVATVAGAAFVVLGARIATDRG